MLAAPVDGLFPAILCFITIDNDVIHNLTVNQSVIIRYVEVIRTFAPIIPLFYPYFRTFSYIFGYNSCVVIDYNILVHGRSLDNDTLFHLVPI